MRTIITKVKAYKFKELSKAAKLKAHEEYNAGLMEIPWQEEIGDSWKALYAAAGVKARDWSIGAWNHSEITARFNHDETGDIKGARAFAWIENNLLAQYRAPWGLNKNDGNLHENGMVRPRGKAGRIKYARWYAPGSVKECPFTGVCFDMDFIDALTKSLRAGDTLKEAFESLADTARELLEGEDEYQQSLEAFKERAEMDEYEFTKDGRRI